MRSQMQQVERRVKGYWFHDGIAEMIGGAVFIALGVYFALTEMLSTGSMAGAALQAGFIVILLGLISGGRMLIKRLKDQYVVPRAGYLEYRVDNKHINQRRIGAAVAGAAMAFAVLALFPMQGPINWVVAITGPVVGGVLILGQARSVGMQRFFYLGIISILLGLGSAFTGWPEGYALGLYYAAMGLCFLISGVLVFRKFLSHNPIRPNASDEK